MEDVVTITGTATLHGVYDTWYDAHVAAESWRNEKWEALVAGGTVGGQQRFIVVIGSCSIRKEPR